jgi:hypothetical protein
LDIFNLKTDWLQQADQAIQRKDAICYDVAALNGQIFDNVKHMKWFREAVALELRRDRASR